MAVDFIETYGSLKDNKLNNKRLKDFDKVIIDHKGTTFKEFRENAEKDIKDLQIEITKIKEEYEKMKSTYGLSISKLLESQEILLKKYQELNNSVNTALSMSGK